MSVIDEMSYICNFDDFGYVDELIFVDHSFILAIINFNDMCQ